MSHLDSSHFASSHFASNHYGPETAIINSGSGLEDARIIRRKSPRNDKDEAELLQILAMIISQIE